jgi:CubicO group peptidase (beta-lactamase class C family)
MRRRDFIIKTSLASGAALAPVRFAGGAPRRSEFSGLDEFIAGVMKQEHVPGAAACIIRGSEIVWSNSYGWSDIDRKIRMSLDRIQNIGSISKTFVATALMQLKELGLLDLDRDINDYLPFPIRNPKHPDAPITTRQLMVHTSSLRDGSAYAYHYACGDARLSLDAWCRAFFTPGGAFYNEAENFYEWAPGEQWKYTNVSFGVLGRIVEAVSGIAFETYCRRNIFERLGMESTSWILADLDLARHSVPYSWVEGGQVRGSSWGDVPLGVIRPDGPTIDASLPDGYQQNCVYSHPNYPDGFLRTTVNDLSRYARAYLGGGSLDGVRILAETSVRDMFTPQGLPSEETAKRTYGLTWYALDSIDGELKWGHGGGDPGITTGIYVLRDHGVAAIVFTNTSSMAARTILDEMLKRAVGAGPDSDSIGTDQT